MADLKAIYGLNEGDQLANLDPETLERLDVLVKATCKHERYWVERLASLEPAAPPYAKRGVASGPARYSSFPLPIPDRVLTIFQGRQSNVLLAAFAALIARLGEADGFDIGYSDAEMKLQARRHETFADQVPLRFDIDGAQSFSEFLDTIDEQLESLKKHSTYACDVVVRYPRLRSAVGQGNGFTLPIAFAKTDSLDDHAPADGNTLFLCDLRERFRMPFCL